MKDPKRWLIRFAQRVAERRPMQSLKRLLTTAMTMVAKPTPKQAEAYGRYCHQLSVAALLGFITLPFTHDGTQTPYVREGFLVTWAVVLFLMGARLSKGE